MRLVIVSSHPDQTRATELAAALGERGHQVSQAGHPFGSADQAVDLGHELADAWQADRPDAAVAQGRLAGLALQVAARAHGVPVVQAFAGAASDPDGAGAAEAARLEGALARSATRVLAASAAELDRLVAAGVRRGAVRVVGLGVDTARFCDSGPAQPRRRAHRVVTQADRPGFVSTLVTLLPTLPDTELVVLDSPGSEPLTAQLDTGGILERAERLQVRDRLTLVGPARVETLPALLRSTDVVVLAGDADDAAFAVRAMACGVPVVGYETGDLGETVVDEVTGVLVRPGSADRLGDALRGLLGDGLRRESLALAATDRARVRYGWATVATTLEAVLTEVVADGTPSGAHDGSVDVAS